ncbi:hypothetical protein IUY40_17340 [Flavobacterium sp. ALJ2]|uniref:hypothetical protein n=1 Tax=Flavobacterium sp. ALJ2 TaxID=2786960 RepID=UPI00189E3ACD|nr:hypothetical protein [Flavobacterium sp. ALJ2]MBF7093301.1 hypothetical protein [Flavobacterium sp. ALJ2]
MYKKLAFFLLLAVFQTISAQIGVNTHAPKATMEIKHIDNGIASGLLLPKITGDQLKAMDHLYNEDQDGALVQVTKAITQQGLEGKTQKVTIPGIYSYSYRTALWENINPPTSIENRTYILINKDGVEDVTYSNAKNIRWGTIEGLNYSNVKISSDRTKIILPKGYIFKVTGMIGISDSSSPTYIVSYFIANPSSKMALSTRGFVESSTENYNDGGVTNPIAVIDASALSVEISLRASGPSNNRKTVITAAPTDYSLGTYLIIEQLL